MIAEYERAQIAERTRRGKLHRARGGSQAVMSGAPYGYRYVKKSDHMEGFWEIDEAQAQVVRDVFDRYVTDGVSIGELARWLTERGVQTKTGKTRWDRSTIWAMLRNPAYRGQAAFGKTKTAERHGGPTRTTRQRGERHGRRLTRHDQPAEKWTLIPVPPLVTEETFALAQARLVDNAHFARRNTKELTLLQGVLVCRECGYSCYRTCTRTEQQADQLLPLHRPGRLAAPRRQAVHQRPGPRRRARPARLGRGPPAAREPRARPRRDRPPPRQALRTEHPAARRREALERDLTRASRRGRAADRGLPRTADLARRAPRPDARAAQAPEHAPSPARQRSTPSCTTPRPTSSSPTRSKGSSAASPTAWTSSTSPASSASCGSSSAKS